MREGGGEEGFPEMGIVLTPGGFRDKLSTMSIDFGVLPGSRNPG
jgi:hypothetical protein